MSGDGVMQALQRQVVFVDTRVPDFHNLIGASILAHEFLLLNDPVTVSTRLPGC